MTTSAAETEEAHHLFDQIGIDPRLLELVRQLPPSQQADLVRALEAGNSLERLFELARTDPLEPHARHLEVLDPAQVETIHHGTLEILDSVGVSFPNRRTLALFGRHGFSVEGDRVRITEDQLWETISSCPPRFEIMGRGGRGPLVIGGERPILMPTAGAPYVIDPSGEHRLATMEDHAEMIKVAQMLPSLDMIPFCIVQPSDFDGSAEELTKQMLYAQMCYSDKPFGCSVANKQAVHASKMMCQLLYGDDAINEYVTLGVVNSLTPLQYSPEVIDAIISFCQWGQPLMIAAMATGGASAPMSRAHLLSLQNAELLAGVVLTQLVREGSPVILGSTSTICDMQTAQPWIGSPECSQLISAHAQLARFYGLPSRSGGALTDSLQVGAQSCTESTNSMNTTVASGVDVVSHAAGTMASYMACSATKMILDDETALRSLQQYNRPLTTEADMEEMLTTLAADGSFLMALDTMQRMRQLWQPQVSRRRTIHQSEDWIDDVEAARLRLKELRLQYEQPPMDRALDILLQRFAGILDHSDDDSTGNWSLTVRTGERRRNAGVVRRLRRGS